MQYKLILFFNFSQPHGSSRWHTNTAKVLPHSSSTTPQLPLKQFWSKALPPACSSSVLTLLFLLDCWYHNHQNKSLDGTLSLLSPHKELLCGLLSVYPLYRQIFIIVKQLIIASPSSYLVWEDNELWGNHWEKSKSDSLSNLGGNYRHSHLICCCWGATSFPGEVMSSERYSDLIVK